MELKVYNINGNDTGRTISVSDSLLGVEPNDHAIWLDVKQYLANQRQGTHKSKERSEVSGSTKKLKRQKGTGGARAGDTNSPTIVGGGRAFGPRPRDYSFKLNKKVKRLARISALTYKAKEDKLIVVEDFSFEAPKTKNMIKLMSALNLGEKKSLFVLNNQDNFVILSARNINTVSVTDAKSVNTYELLRAKNVIFSETAIKELENLVINS
ncbi:MAG: 50S ribosomal protein L4 [Bacteroidales bacterium]|jgi:large subunit ribosomal protein L4|nr:50S ribosomal protein L4 [Bacteroidales bacterium]NCC17337.1 50S ribosomal protein L4 [Bacteroidia bacterium]MDD2575886.1 50S ribosomal protein L4 [Bacteroidales bacterium]MDD3286518.1 50S ribosomal protein L4 [Bacteroidales bacterium]MDD3667359.1 50S ribosomal protein L4 [Bacteroidales bacterium]